MNKVIIKLRDLIIKKYWKTFNDTSCTHKIFTSGRAGTKSSRGALKVVNKIISDDDCSVVVIRKFHNKLRKTVYKELLRAIKRMKLDKKDFKITASPMEIKYLPNGNTIYFTGSDSIDDTKGMIDELKSIKLVIIDELTEFFDKGDGEDELLNIEATFVRGNSDEFCMEYYFNPPKNQRAPIMVWLEKMKLRSDTIHIHTDYRDVPVEWLGQKLIDSALELMRNDEKMYRWIWLGECVGIDDVIYYMFDDLVHICDDYDINDLSYISVGIDYGQKNPTTYEAFGIDYKRKCLQGIDEYYHCGREQGQKSPSEYAQDFKAFKENIEKETNKFVYEVYIDPSAKGLAEEIKRVCPTVKIKDADNTVALGIQRQSKLLSLRRLFICSKQTRLKQEMYLYQYDEDSIERGKEIPLKTNDHCQDATRYLVMGVWRILKTLLKIRLDDEE